jgi:hypothetical protein
MFMTPLFLSFYFVTRADGAPVVYVSWQEGVEVVREESGQIDTAWFRRKRILRKSPGRRFFPF